MERYHRGTACLRACNLEEVMLSAIRWLSLNGIFIEHNTKKQREKSQTKEMWATRVKRSGFWCFFGFFFQASASAAATPCVPTTCWLIPRRQPSRSVGSLSCQQTIKQRIIYQAPLKVNKQIPRWVAGVWERSDGVTSGSLQKQWSLRFPGSNPGRCHLGLAELGALESRRILDWDAANWAPPLDGITEFSCPEGARCRAKLCCERREEGKAHKDEGLRLLPSASVTQAFVWANGDDGCTFTFQC